MTMKKRLGCALGLIALAGCLQTPARAQIAYVPEVGAIPSGVTMTVTPVVSPDRRYVRLSVNTFVNSLIGFQTLSFPGGAVGGGNFGGLGGGFNAGMNGVIGDEGYESGTQVGNGMNGPVLPQPGAMEPGALPGGQGFVGGDPLLAGGQGGGFGWMPVNEEEAALMMMGMDNGPRRSVGSSSRSRSRTARQPARKTTRPARRQKSTTQNKSR